MTVQYDEVYDQMEDKKVEEVEKKKVDRKPKYIKNLLKSAEIRQKEFERRVERKVGVIWRITLTKTSFI